MNEVLLNVKAVCDTALKWGGLESNLSTPCLGINNYCVSLSL